jgi:hypothetical protein
LLAQTTVDASIFTSPPLKSPVVHEADS